MKRSAVWRYFDQEESDTTKVSCTICGEVLSRANNTSNLFKHLNVNTTQSTEQWMQRTRNRKSPQASKRKATPKQMTLPTALQRGTTYPIALR